mmetsp:Transcript_5490/g.13557  ORF Transcript_5490/g.13557 Transcript_5490/m.13557 type:complete len:397 (+) Transcript_5490:1101-2291(+)
MIEKHLALSLVGGERIQFVQIQENRNVVGGRQFEGGLEQCQVGVEGGPSEAQHALVDLALFSPLAPPLAFSGLGGCLVCCFAHNGRPMIAVRERIVVPPSARLLSFPCSTFVVVVVVVIVKPIGFSTHRTGRLRDFLGAVHSGSRFSRSVSFGFHGRFLTLGDLHGSIRDSGELPNYFIDHGCDILPPTNNAIDFDHAVQNARTTTVVVVAAALELLLACFQDTLEQECFTAAPDSHQDRCRGGGHRIPERQRRRRRTGRRWCAGRTGIALRRPVQCREEDRVQLLEGILQTGGCKLFENACVAVETRLFVVFGAWETTSTSNVTISETRDGGIQICNYGPRFVRRGVRFFGCRCFRILHRIILCILHVDHGSLLLHPSVSPSTSFLLLLMIVDRL